MNIVRKQVEFESRLSFFHPHSNSLVDRLQFSAPFESSGRKFDVKCALSPLFGRLYNNEYFTVARRDTQMYLDGIGHT